MGISGSHLVLGNKNPKWVEREENTGGGAIFFLVIAVAICSWPFH